MTADTIHTCSYSCERPECIRAQRDELAARVCKDLDDEALAKEGRLACGAECAAAITDLAARMNVHCEVNHE